MNLRCLFNSLSNRALFPIINNIRPFTINMGKSLSKTNCCAVDQISSNITFSGEVDKQGLSLDDEPILTNSSLDESREAPMPSFNLTFACNYIQKSDQVQEWPVCLSVECGEVPLEERPGMDIVCLIETSTFTKGKEKWIRNAVEFMMNRMTGQDRLSIVSFAENGKRLTPFVSMAFTGKIRINLVLQGLQYHGFCDIEEGIKAALSVFSNRRNINSHSYLITMTAGYDNHPESLKERLSELLRDFNMHTSLLFTGHVFSLADPVPILNFIAEETNGTLYLSQDESQWFKNIAYCCGILESKVAEEVFAEISMLHEMAPVVLSKVYSESGEPRFRMPDVLAGSKMELVFLLRFLPQANYKYPKSNLLKVDVQYSIRGTKYNESKFLMVPFVASIIMMREIELDEEVLVGFYRVKVADILNEASLLAESDVEAAKILLISGGKELEESCVFGNRFIRSLSEEILELAEKVENSPGLSALIRNQARNHWSKRRFDVEFYQNYATIINKNRLKVLFNIS